jgi:hypothetical protein
MYAVHVHSQQKHVVTGAPFFSFQKNQTPTPLVGGYDKIVRLLDVAKGTEKRTFTGHSRV